jgi:hypothetical protein
MAIHKSAMGRTVDMAALSGKNEKVRAVGNMGVNARGDILDSNNRIIQDNTQRVKSSYQNTVAAETPAHLTPSTPRPATQLQADPTPTITEDEPVELLPEEAELFEDDEDETK